MRTQTQVNQSILEMYFNMLIPIAGDLLEPRCEQIRVLLISSKALTFSVLMERPFCRVRGSPTRRSWNSSKARVFITRSFNGSPPRPSRTVRWAITRVVGFHSTVVVEIGYTVWASSFTACQIAFQAILKNPSRSLPTLTARL